ncbi:MULTISPECIES: manganese efflux pump [Stakelama]|uniref:Manganese efflux pump n=2 Tax=Stakelama TaxID=1124625 RepID=A0ABZ0B8A3_9SPHN|nr:MULTISPECIES: manganese efflux pump [Stakelama]MAW98423.1 hypothetical protein [Sphingomonas sp.]TDN85327.1 putative manganese efflux pump [Stakelama pacifica]WNO53505.1 manganese efflux pump [Stakelama sp. W311]|tara:strand:- start:1305 stop:1433 length:129 start_codon:yes stop_codon:yes gene_type:complete
MATIGVLLGRKADEYMGKSAEVLGRVALIVIDVSMLHQHIWA